MRGLEVLDPATECSCHAHLFGKLVQLLQTKDRGPTGPTDEQPIEHQTRAFMRADFDLGEL
jgi:hypothetical protein